MWTTDTFRRWFDPWNPLAGWKPAAPGHCPKCSGPVWHPGCSAYDVNGAPMHRAAYLPQRPPGGSTDVLR